MCKYRIGFLIFKPPELQTRKTRDPYVILSLQQCVVCFAFSPAPLPLPDHFVHNNVLEYSEQSFLFP